jgi:hypothetical protein
MLKCCRVEDGTKISVFPGKARYFSAQDELGDYKLVEKFKPLLQEEIAKTMNTYERVGYSIEVSWFLLG